MVLNQNSRNRQLLPLVHGRWYSQGWMKCLVASWELELFDDVLLIYIRKTIGAASQVLIVLPETWRRSENPRKRDFRKDLPITVGFDEAPYSSSKHCINFID
jgi:hypothetical protein